MNLTGHNKWSNQRTKALILTAALTVLLCMVYALGFLLPEEAAGSDLLHAKQPPSWAHPFGTDNLGRDLLMRTLKGLSVSMTVGIVSSCISAVIAILIGIAAATGSRFTDGVINWIIDLTMGIPHAVLIILISFSLGRGLRGLMAGIAATHWTSLARLMRGEVMQLRSQHYIAVSRRLGRSGGWIMVHHLLPHLAPQFTVGLILMFPHAILHEASISFLGYGLPPEQPAVGIILAESMRYLSSGMWWMAVLPGLLLVLVVLMIDCLGETVRTVIDPGSAQRRQG